MTHIEYIEKQLNIIRFSGEKLHEIIKLLGCIEYFLENNLITRDEASFYMRRADSFMNSYPDAQESTEGSE